MIEVPITKELRELAEAKAQERIAFKRKHTKDYKVVKNDKAYQNEVAGILGELVVGTLISQTPNFELYKRSGDKDYDFIHKDKKIDVKSSYNPNAERLFLFPEEEEGDVDMFVAVKIGDSSAQVMGYVTKDEAIAAPLQKFIYGPRKIFKYTDLKPLEQFLT